MRSFACLLVVFLVCFTSQCLAFVHKIDPADASKSLKSATKDFTDIYRRLSKVKSTPNNADVLNKLRENTMLEALMEESLLSPTEQQAPEHDRMLFDVAGAQVSPSTPYKYSYVEQSRFLQTTFYSDPNCMKQATLGSTALMTNLCRPFMSGGLHAMISSLQVNNATHTYHTPQLRLYTDSACRYQASVETLSSAQQGACEAIYDENNNFFLAMKMDVRNFFPGNIRGALVKLHKTANMCRLSKPDERITEYMLLPQNKCFFNFYDETAYRMVSCSGNRIGYMVYLDPSCEQTKFEETLYYEGTASCDEATTISGMNSGFPSFHCVGYN